jgi:hypothetical protein
MPNPTKKKQEEKPSFKGSTDAGSREANTDGLKVIKYYGLRTSKRILSLRIGE